MVRSAETEFSSLAYRQVPSVEWVDDEGFVAQVDDAGDPVASLECGHGARDELAATEVFDGAMVVTVLNILRNEERFSAVSCQASCQEAKGREAKSQANVAKSPSQGLSTFEPF